MKKIRLQSSTNSELKDRITTYLNEYKSGKMKTVSHEDMWDSIDIECSKRMSKLISIEEAKYIDEYKIYLKFDDGKENTLDFREFITKSQHPDIKKYENIELFKNFTLEYGDLEWNDYELAFPIYDLYIGKI